MILTPNNLPETLLNIQKVKIETAPATQTKATILRRKKRDSGYDCEYADLDCIRQTYLVKNGHIKV